MSNPTTTQEWQQASADIEAQIVQLEDQIAQATDQQLQNSVQVRQARQQLNALPVGSAEREALNNRIIQLDTQTAQLEVAKSQIANQISPLNVSLLNAESQATSSATGLPGTNVVPPPETASGLPGTTVVLPPATSSTAPTVATANLDTLAAQGPAVQESVFDPRQDPGENVFEPGETINANGESVFDPESIDAADDPFEAERLAAEQRLNDEPLTIEAEPLTAGEQAQLEFEQEQNRTLLAAEDVDPEADPFEAERLAAEQRLNDEPTLNAEDVDTTQDSGLSDEEILARQNPGGLSDEEVLARQQAAEQAAAKANAINQATLQSRYKQPGNTDWRVRLALAPSSFYLYNVLGSGTGSPGAGILAPLAQSNGVIFPYMPQISTMYRANYAQYDLIHSNFRGVYYQSSRVDDIQIRGTFTAQDTTEAAYLLAVIHFFRSVTKMFYGKDAERGTPPPLVYLSGLGDYQFSKHPCLVSQFSYTLPNDVDYIRATNPNDYGGNLLSRRTPTQSAPGGINFAGARRLANALTSDGQAVAPGATPQTPQQNSVVGRVNNTGDFSTYVPTMMEIDITLIPVQTRSQVSKQFSLKDFANGNLLKGGFW